MESGAPSLYERGRKAVRPELVEGPRWFDKLTTSGFGARSKAFRRTSSLSRGRGDLPGNHRGV